MKVEDVHEPVRVEERRGPDDRLIDDAEDRDAGADAERQRQHDEDRVAGTRREPPHGQSNILGDRHVASFACVAL
jgi:hypothetical protein